VVWDGVRTLPILPAALIACGANGACGGGRPAVQPATRPAEARTARPPVDVRFLERDAAGAPWHPVRNAARVADLHRMIDNEPARFALALYRLAWELAPPAEPTGGPVLFIGLEEGGNHAETGLSLVEDGRRRDLPALPYLRLEEDRDSLRGTLLHETGHAVHALLVTGVPLSEHDGAIAPIPHSTFAVTDRRTAFNEGLAIHLEAIHGHCGQEAETRAFYDHAAFRHGPTGDRSNEYFFPVKDVMTYAQTFARYQAVRDGLFAFETAARGDYLRVQLDPARDLRTLRDPGSIVASEGFVASILFQVIARQGCAAGLVPLLPRYRALFLALRDAESRRGAVPLVDLVIALGGDAVAVFLDLSRGVTVDPEAAALWARLYDASLALDIETRTAIFDDLEARRTRWRDEVAADPSRLARRIGPIVAVKASRKVGVAMFGGLQPMSFDLNAAGAPILRLVPGWTEAHVDALLAERAARPFASLADLRARLGTRRVPVDALAPL
jgi:hypothetical protein